MGRTFQNIGAFAPATEWEGTLLGRERAPAARDLPWSIATPRSASIFAARVAIATVIWTAGERKTPEPPWSLAAALKRLSVPTSRERIALRCYSRNGVSIAMPRFNIAKGIPGTAWHTEGIHLLEKFAQDDRIRVPHPKENLQIKRTQPLAGGNKFVSFIDAVGELDGKHCLIDWKTTASRYTEAPEGLLSLDPQLICYSWIRVGFGNVACSWSL